MTVAVAVVAAASSTGNQDITTSDLGGATPKAVVFFYSRAASDGTINNDAGISIGMTDGTNHTATATFKRHGLTSYTAATGQAKVGKTDKCITALHWSGAAIAVHSEASFVSFIANGVRVNWSTATADGWLITALFFEGSDWTVYGGTTLVVPGTVTTIGDQADLIFTLGVGDTLAGTITAGRWNTTFGATTFPLGPAVSRHLVTWSNFLTTNQSVDWQGNYAGGRFDIAGAGTVYGFNISRTATTFTISGGAAGTDTVGYLAFKYTGEGRIQAGTLDMSNTTGDQVFTGFGGEPGGFLMLLTAQHLEFNNIDLRCGFSVHSPTKGGGFAVGGKVDNTTVSASNPTAMYNTVMVDKIRTLHNDGTENSRSTVSSFDSDGVTLNFTDAPNFDATRIQFADWRWEYLTIVGYSAPASSGRNQAWIID